MNDEWRFHWRKQLVWGILFIAVGVLVLMDRAGVVEVDLDLARMWRYWPVLLVVIGLTQMIPPTTPRHFLRGLWHIFFAGWWYVSFQHVWGLSFADTWPALLVVWGLGLVTRPMLYKAISNNRSDRDA